MLTSIPFLPYFDFPADHEAFYKAFEPWRIDYAVDSMRSEGVYILLSSKPVSRCFGVDPEGILYIGKGVILSANHRIGKLVNALNDREAAHEAGVRYQLRKYASRYSIGDLRIRVIVCPQSRSIEKDLFGTYLNLYGELPPLNHQV